MNSLENYKDLMHSPLFQEGPIVVFVWQNREGWPVEDVSSNLKRMFHYDPEDYLSSKLHYSDQIHPDDMERVAREVEEASSSGVATFTHQPYRYLNGQGKYRWVQDSTMIQRDDNGEITHYFGYLSDITTQMELTQRLESDLVERKRNEKILHETLELQSAIFDNIDYMLITTDREGFITQFNKKAEETLGYCAEELLYRETPKIFHLEEEIVQRAQQFSQELGEELTSGFEVFVAKTDRGLANEHEWTYVCKYGTYIPVSLSITALRDPYGKIIGYIGMAKDISELKKTREKLLHAKEEAEASNQAKSRFLANMSHEIRTPLNAIMGFIDLLKKEESDEKRLNYFNIVQSSSNTLLNVINDILDISKIEDNKLEIEYVDFDVKDACRTMVNFFHSSLEKKSITLKLESLEELPQLLYCDPLRIRQIVSNLISNAIKFSPENSTITLSLKYVERELYISVKDEGIGIAEEVKEKIFLPFEQAESSTTREFGGTGLGLSISRRLAQLLGGDIQLISTLGEGSTFIVHIHAPIAKESTSQEEMDQDLELKGHILLAEDNKTNQTLMGIILDDFGLSFKIASNGYEALKLCQEEEFDLILMDINMPECDGEDATKLIRSKQNRCQKTPIIALTANAMKEDVERYMDIGMNDYLSKPVNMAKLEKKLFRYLQ